MAFQSLSGNSGVSALEQSVKLPVDLRRFNPFQGILAFPQRCCPCRPAGQAFRFNPFQGILAFPPGKEGPCSGSKRQVSIPFREFWRFRLVWRDPVEAAYFVSIPFREFWRFRASYRARRIRCTTCFNPFQGILAFPRTVAPGQGQLSAIVSIPFREFWRFRQNESPCSVCHDKFQSLSGNSGVSATFRKGPPHFGQTPSFQSLSGNSGVSALFGRQIKIVVKKFQSLSGNSGVSATRRL